MKSTDISQATNPDVRGSLAAMHRAAEMARKIAIQTRTNLIIYENGQVVKIPLKELVRRAERNGNSTPGSEPPE